jgi:hypothetical protein
MNINLQVILRPEAVVFLLPNPVQDVGFSASLLRTEAGYQFSRYGLSIYNAMKQSACIAR